MPGYLIFEVVICLNLKVELECLVFGRFWMVGDLTSFYTRVMKMQRPGMPMEQVGQIIKHVDTLLSYSMSS